MARPREFAIDTVLRNAMEAFWKRGYVATSMADIYAATGLKPGNLYANFKDKDALFRRAFETYAADFRATLPKETQGRAAIEAWLRLQAELATADRERKGCLIVNTMAEREAHSAETRAMADARMQEISEFFARHLEIAVAKGEVSSIHGQGRMRDALTGTVVAIMSLARGGSSDAVIWNVAEQAIASLGQDHRDGLSSEGATRPH